MSEEERDPLVPEGVARGREKWEERARRSFDRVAPWKTDFTTVSSQPVPELCAPDTQPAFDFERDLGWPGEYPFTRGVQPTMYRGKLWTMRLFAGYGSARQTNARFRYLLAHGQTGLSTAFHLPTLYGYDSDHEMAKGEVGKCGVAIDTLADMETLFDGIDLGAVTTSMTINSTAPIALAMYLAVAEKHGTPWSRVGGTLQNDILKEYIAQKEYIFPPRPSMRLITDQFRFCAENVPKWNTISISGYHIREAGSTALQELAFTLRDGVEYVQYGIDAGLDVDVFAPRLSFFFNSHNDFFEEIAKFRAARRVWGKTMRERFGAKDPRSWACRFHTQTAGCSLTAQQPYNNVVRTAIQALAAVLGGTNSLHTNSLDETLALPTDFAVKVALRTQQILAHESGVANTIDPLGGSYFVEEMTTRMEQGTFDYFRQIDAFGGMVEAIEAGFPQKEIMDAAYRYQRALDDGEKVMVGVNDFTDSGEEPPLPILYIDETTEDEQRAALAAIKRTRDGKAVVSKLGDLRQACRDGRNVMPALVDAVKTYATVGEISDVMREVFATYEEPVVFFDAPSADGHDGNVPAVMEGGAPMRDAREFFSPPDETDASLGRVATGVVGSEILKIAADVRQALSRGERIANLTVGDFAPDQFPIPERLEAEIDRAYREHQTNYPPSDGVLALREAVSEFLMRDQGLSYPVESILIGGGARPILYGTYRTILDRGDTVVYSVPSWNNNHYVHLTETRAIELEGRKENGFFPSAAEFAPHLSEARLVVLNSPLNPTGTVVAPSELAQISAMIVEENARRRRAGRKSLFILYDQIYSALHFGNARRSSPPELVPEIFPYTVLLDGISKQFAATGLRVGWAVGPPALIRRMGDILGHVGAWAPKPEQVATARFLRDPAAVLDHRARFAAAIASRLDLLYGIFARLKGEGLPVDAIEPQGAIYLSARFDLVGGEVGGNVLKSNEEIRRLLLERAGIAAVPFQAFGYRPETGWFRLSVGAVSEEEIRQAEPRLRALIGSVRLAAVSR